MQHQCNGNVRASFQTGASHLVPAREVLRSVQRVVPHMSNYEAHHLMAELNERSPTQDGRVGEEELRQALRLVE
eukprot:9394066-Pyramimonas_sp.AAC.1